MKQWKESATIGNLELKNRVLRSATNDYRGRPDGGISEEQREIYRELSMGELGLIITGNFFVSEDGRVDGEQNSLCDGEHLRSVQQLMELMHKSDNLVVAQLSHAGMKNKVNPVAREKYSDISLLSMEEIHTIEDQFVQAAVNAKRCGFDGIQIHLAHDYLLSSFLNPIRNQRHDRYGYDTEGRMLIVNNIINQIRLILGKDYPILVKFPVTILEQSGQEYQEECCRMVMKLQKMALDAIEISGAGLGTFRKQDHLYYLAQLKELRKVTDLPLILTGGIRTLEDIEIAIEEGADFIGLSRPLIQDPYYIPHQLTKRLPSGCISCNACYNLKERYGRRCAIREKGGELI